MVEGIPYPCVLYGLSKKIATIFDKIDIVIKKHYKQIEILDKIAKSLFCGVISKYKYLPNAMLVN